MKVVVEAKMQACGVWFCVVLASCSGSPAPKVNAGRDTVPSPTCYISAATRTVICTPAP